MRSVEEGSKCCGINRWRLERGEKWTCRRCEGAEREESEREEGVVVKVVIEGGKCIRCGKMRSKGQGIECRGCGKIVHVKCARLGSRKLAERSRDRRRCEECEE